MYGSTTSIYSNFLCVFRALQKSTSIPVHLSVSRTNEVGLPPGLRPKHNLTSTASNGAHQTGLENNFHTYKIQSFSFWLIWNLKKPKEIQKLQLLKKSHPPFFRLNFWMAYFLTFLSFYILIFFVNCKEQVVFRNTNPKILPKELEDAFFLV